MHSCVLLRGRCVGQKADWRGRMSIKNVLEALRVGCRQLSYFCPISPQRIDESERHHRAETLTRLLSSTVLTDDDLSIERSPVIRRLHFHWVDHPPVTTA